MATVVKSQTYSFATENAEAVIVFLVKTNFPAWLQQQMDKHDPPLGQRELARRTKPKVSVGFISNVLSGQRTPGVKFCQGVAYGLGIPQARVFFEAGLMTEKTTGELVDLAPEIKRVMQELEALTPDRRAIAISALEGMLERWGRNWQPQRQTGEGKP